MLNLRSILLARDFSSVSDQAARRAVDLAERTGATLHVLYAQVLHDDPFGADDAPAPAADVDAIRKRLTEVDDKPLQSRKEIEVVEAVERDVSAGPAIRHYADEHDIDLVVMGTHGRRGVRRMLLGSVAEDVVRRADQPVLTVRGTEEDRPTAIRRILVPVDFSPYSRDALRTARAMASLVGATVDAVHVVEETLHPAFYVGGVRSIYDIAPDIEEKATAKLEEFLAETPGAADDETARVLFGKPSACIAEEAEDADLVVMSTHGRTGLDRFLLGSVAERVVRHAPCPVLTVKAFGRSLLATEDAAEEGAASSAQQP
jgi:nucleotide-binding universal stress UspA family protein